MGKQVGARYHLQDLGLALCTLKSEKMSAKYDAT